MSEVARWVATKIRSAHIQQELESFAANWGLWVGGRVDWRGGVRWGAGWDGTELQGRVGGGGVSFSSSAYEQRHSSTTSITEDGLCLMLREPAPAALRPQALLLHISTTECERAAHSWGKYSPSRESVWWMSHLGGKPPALRTYHAHKNGGPLASYALGK